VASSPVLDTPVSPSTVPSFDVGDIFSDCPQGSIGNAVGVKTRCASKPECYAGINNISGNVSARKLACNTAHTWETFLIGALPEDVKSAKYDDVAGDPYVKSLCSDGVLSLALKGQPATGWQTEILPPSESEYASGKREFRCVAGKGLDKLNRSYFGPKK
jgi:hypothetical protein